MKTSHTISERVYEFWFQPVSAAGFGMMRMAFGLIGFVTMILELPNVQRFYGPSGILTHEMLPSVVRSAWRFSLLDSASVNAVWWLYGALLASFFCVIIGLGRKWTLLAAVILLFSFHEYGTITLDGGDTLLRLIGFILLLSPCYRAFTVRNFRLRMTLVAETGKDQLPTKRTMPIWPYRLLLWQMILIYVASALEKWSGDTWREGSAVAITLHLTDFSRLTPWMADRLSVMSPGIGYFTVFSQMAWGALLVIGLLVALGILRREDTNTLKRALMLSGLVVHGSIFVFMDVGTFSLTVFAAYLGLLLDDDFHAIRSRLRMKEPVVVLFDGRCGFCKRSILTLSMMDWLRRLQFSSYHDPDNKKRYAPDLSHETLNKEMHVRLRDGSYKKGFFAFRALTWHLPALWPLAPLLYIPGVSVIGSAAYTYIADHR